MRNGYLRKAGPLQRLVGLGEVRTAAHGKSTKRPAVIASLERNDLVFPRTPATQPVMTCDLNRALVGLRAAHGVEGVPEIAGRQLREPRGQLGGRPVGELPRRRVIRKGGSLLA